MLGVVTMSLRALTGVYDFEGKAAEPLPPPQLMRKLKNDLNLDGVMFISTQMHMPGLDESILREIRSTAEELGMYVEGGSGGTDPDVIERDLWATKSMGGKVLKSYFGYLLRPETIRSSDDWYEFEKEQKAKLEVVEKLARRYDVKVAFENHLDITWEEMLSFMKHVDSEYIGVALDTANPLGIIQDPVETARQLGPYTIATHLKDWRMIEEEKGFTVMPVPLGKGDVDLKEIVKILKAANPELNYSIELDMHRIHQIPWLNHDFWRGFPNRNIHDVVKVINLIRKDGSPRTSEELKALPAMKGARVEELVDHELDYLGQSITYCREELGL